MNALAQRVDTRNPLPKSVLLDAIRASTIKSRMLTNALDGVGVMLSKGLISENEAIDEVNSFGALCLVLAEIIHCPEGAP